MIVGLSPYAYGKVVVNLARENMDRSTCCTSRKSVKDPNVVYSAQHDLLEIIMFLYDAFLVTNILF